MNKLIFRTFPLLLMVVAMLFGLASFVGKLYASGEDWADARWNGNAFSAGRLKRGTVTDRNGAPLIEFTPEGTTYTPDTQLRIASLHTLGDREGNIAFGVEKRFHRELLGYSFYEGLNIPAALALSLDATLQKTAWEAMDGRNGVVAVANYRTGELLCLVSAPSFDPEEPEAVPEGAYLNRFTSAAYPPGSVFKLVTLTAAISSLKDIFDREFTCTGSADFGSNRVTCPRAHGQMKLEDAFAKSCNCVFGALACELGAERMHAAAEELGLLEEFEIDAAPVRAGRYDERFTDAIELAWSGSGQHTDLVTPAAMLRLVSAVAADGEAHPLTLLLNRETAATRLLEEETAEKIKNMMTYNVYLTYGRENFPNLPLAAKSGTAEVGGGAAPHAWFVGFLTDEAHPYAFVVVLEHGGWGSSAAGSVANTVLQKALAKAPTS
ncbi:MAG: penicillin-binding transpeptidase domain-containing protein [bacterium]